MKTIAIIFDISSNFYKQRSMIEVVKNQLISFLKKTSFNDRVYFFQEEDITMPDSPGVAISKIKDCKSESIDIETGLKQSIYVLAMEGNDLDKNIIFITDKFEKQDEIKFKRGINFDIKERVGCRFKILSLNSSSLSEICNSYYNCDYEQVLPEEIDDRINDFCNQKT